jgi:NAD(P)-dependent dehydrogenase (short-subunit alcohol dehydrogenase family)
MHFGVNHLGHFALTGLLLDKLLNTPGSRVITTTSLLQSIGWLDFNDLQSKRSYLGLLAYGQSKLANMLFAAELERRLKAEGATTLSLAAHAGFSNTRMTRTGNGPSGTYLEELLFRFSTGVIAQSAAMGALPQLYAATTPGIKGGELYGPLFYTHGYPSLNFRALQAYDGAATVRLWHASEELTGVRYAISPLETLPSPSEIKDFVNQELRHFYSRN